MQIESLKLVWQFKSLVAGQKSTSIMLIMEDGRDVSEKNTTDILSECRGELYGDTLANTENADMYVVLKSMLYILAKV